jgi:phosphoribosylaminoimidazole-succinocarboxamide synthase
MTRAQITNSITQTNLPLPNRRQGKVRDIYDAALTDGTPVLLIVASDRISAFDVVMPNPIPGKGIVLTQISKFWFAMIGRKLAGKLTHHLIATDASNVAGLSDAQKKSLDRRVMVGRKCRVVPIECIVRGYLAGSGWAEYKKSQTVCGIQLPAGLRQCDKLPEPIFTPSTKAETGHDENITFDQACELQGRELVTQLRDLSLAIYQMAHDYAAQRGIILADTKFEFGLPVDGSGQVAKWPSGQVANAATRDPRRETRDVPILIDEVLTPDSSRFWPADKYQPGQDQPSFDKQFVRNYLEGLVKAGQWNKTPPGPQLPAEVVEGTLAKYLEAFRLLTGDDLRF